MNPWRRFRLWIFLKDMRREHKALARSFEEDPRAEAALAMCTCYPADLEEWSGHGPSCRTWLS